NTRRLGPPRPEIASQSPRLSSRIAAARPHDRTGHELCNSATATAGGADARWTGAIMAQIFNPSTNTIAKVTIYAAALILAALTWTCVALNRSSYMTGQDITRPQPVPFSHNHHVAGLGIDCRYCHTSVETMAFAGVPPTATCMNCHQIIWSDS